MTRPDAATRAAVETVWRIEAARVIGGLVRLVGDVGRAEDLAQEALCAALEHWPATGIPSRPGAWLLTAARNKALDEKRRAARVRDAADVDLLAIPAAPADDGEPDRVRDDVLGLMLLAGHPVLPVESRVALILRLVAGLSTAEIARAYLTREATIAQRIVRAKRTLAEARVELEPPAGAALKERLPATLEALYLVFNEGYAASAGEAWIRRELCDEALRLARVLAALVPDEAEVHGLVALIELQAARFPARVGPRGEAVLLLDQDRARWDRLLIGRGLAALERAAALARPLGPYALQAAIAACHARARTAAETDWARIVALYDALVERTGSPVVELNRAAAVSMAYGPADALELVDALAEDPALAGYHPVPALRGDLLLRLGRAREARAELERAAELCGNAREREALRARAAGCA